MSEIGTRSFKFGRPAQNIWTPCCGEGEADVYDRVYCGLTKMYFVRVRKYALLFGPIEGINKKLFTLTRIIMVNSP
jgi:hypothetical protein